MIWKDGKWGKYLGIPPATAIKEYSHFMIGPQTGSVIFSLHKQDERFEKELDAIINVHVGLESTGDLGCVDLCVSNSAALMGAHPSERLLGPPRDDWKAYYNRRTKPKELQPRPVSELR